MAEDTIEETSEEIPDIPKTGIKKLLANKLVLIGAAVFLVIIIAAATYFLLFTNDKPEEIPEKPTPLITKDLGPPEEEKIESDIKQIENENADADADADADVNQTPTDKPRVERIADSIKQNALLSKDNQTSSTEALKTKDENDNTLIKQIEALKKQNKDLQAYIKNLNKSADMPKKDLSVPIDRMIQQTPAAKENESQAKPKPIPDNPYMHLDDFDNSSNYYSSPYADDEQVPKPTWGD